MAVIARPGAPEPHRMNSPLPTDCPAPSGLSQQPFKALMLAAAAGAALALLGRILVSGRRPLPLNHHKE